MICRRTFLAGTGAVLLATPLAAGAQQATKVYHIGLLATRPSPVIFDAFGAEMQRYGWTEGRDYTLESRFTEGYYHRAPALASELVSRPVDILLTVNPANASVARDASRVIPIVMVTSGYPVEAGLAVSLGRPGGNVTGNSSYAGAEVFAKHLSLIREVKSTIRRMGILWDYAPPAFDPRDAETALAELRRAASTLGVTLSLCGGGSVALAPRAIGSESGLWHCCGIGSESGRCLSVADYVRGLAATRVATAAPAC